MDSYSILVGLAFVTVALLAFAALLVTRDLSGNATTNHSSDRASLRRLPFVGPPDPSAGWASQIDRHLHRLIIDAGVNGDLLTVSLVLIGGGVLVGGPLWVWLENPLFAALGTMAGMAVVYGWLCWQRAKRLRLAGEQLPDVLELLARAVRAGESLDQAVELVGQNAAEPLGLEFRRAASQLRLGLSVSSAMHALADRIPLMETKILSTTLAVHRQSGGNVATTLERLAAVVRDRIQYRRQLRVVTGAGRASAFVISSVGPMLFAYLFIVHPGYVRSLIEQPVGQGLLAIAVALELVGLWWISRLLRKEM